MTVVRAAGGDAPAGYWFGARHTLGQSQLLVVAVLFVAVLVVLVTYHRRLIVPHRINPLLFASLAPWDLRLTAMFGMVAAVLFSATIFKLSIDSDRIRPYIWHAEWHFFYLVLALALWALLLR